MSNQIQVTTAQVKSKRNELHQINTSFKAKLEDMTTTEKALRTMWEGDASDAFDKQYANDHKKMMMLYKAVEDYCRALDTITKKYETTETKNIQIIKTRS